MLAAILAALTLLVAPDSSLTVEPTCPGRQVVERDQIEASGAVRLAGLLRLLDAPRRQTTHGFLWPTLFGESAPGAPGETALVIDGEPLAADLLGLGDLERIPADVPDLVRVTFCPGPQFIGGRSWSGGALFLATRDDPGLRGAVFIGNEVGDPGPFRYLNGNVNIDKFGPDYSGAAVWRDSTAAIPSADARFKIRRFYATDPEVIARTLNALDTFPRLRSVAGEARSEMHALGGTHRASVMASGGNLLPFLPMLGQEVPAQPIWAQGSVSGSIPLHSGLGLSYRVRRSFEQVRTQNPAFPANLRWTASAWHGGIELQSARRRYQTTGGITVDHVWFGEREARGFAVGRVHVGLSGRGGAAGATSALGTGGVGGTAWGSLAYTGAGTSLVATLDVGRTLPEDIAGLGYWQSRGYARFRLASVDRRVEALTSRDAARLRLDGAYTVGALRFTGTAGLRASRGVWLEEARFAALDPLGLPATGVAAYTADASGLDGHAGVAAAGGRGAARFRLFADVRGAVTGTAAYREAWRTAPSVRTGGRVSLHPDRSFSVFTSLEVRSATRWAAYAAGGRARLPPVALLDASVQKSLWGSRLHTSLLFRNLLGAPERYQPRGVVLDLRLYARAVLSLP